MTLWLRASGESWDYVRSAGAYTALTYAKRANVQARDRMCHSFDSVRYVHHRPSARKDCYYYKVGKNTYYLSALNCRTFVTNGLAYPRALSRYKNLCSRKPSSVLLNPSVSA